MQEILLIKQRKYQIQHAFCPYQLISEHHHRVSHRIANMKKDYFYCKNFFEGLIRFNYMCWDLPMGEWCLVNWIMQDRIFHSYQVNASDLALAGDD